MSNAIFPALVGLGWNVAREPVWQTRRRRAVSGKELRIADWSYPIWRWRLAYDVLRSDAVNLEWQTLAAFFNARQGGFDSFLYADADDNAVTDQAIGTGDGATAIFQLVRTLTGIGASFVEPIIAPNVVTNVKINGVVQGGGTYTVNATTGQITFNAAPGAGLPITATFSYYWRCAFEDDELSFEKFALQMWEGRSVAFASLKVA